MSLDVSKFRGSIPPGYLSKDVKIYEGKLPDNLSGHVFIVAPFHRENDRHLFTGEGVIIKWDLQPQEGQIKVHSKKLKTWDSWWHFIHGKLLSRAYFPAKLGLFGVAEIANTAIVNLDDRLILTADAGRYWEVDPNTLETITPIGYFDEHIVSVPVSVFPMVANTAHPFYDPEIKQLITCELKSKPRQGNLFTDMVSEPYITLWDGQGKDGKDKNHTGIRHWKVDGTVLDGSPHTTIVTEELVMIPNMPFQMGVAMLLGLKVPPRKAYPKTQVYLVNRNDLKSDRERVPSRLVTFDGDSYHFLCNYHHEEDGSIKMVAIQQPTISLTEAIEPGDVQHFTGDRYSDKYYGIPWMFGFDPGVLRKVIIKDAQLIKEEAFSHPGWFSTTLYTADQRELKKPEGYSAIYQVYAGYYRDLISRRQYLSFRDHENRFLTDEQLPQADLPSVLAKVPLEKDWQELTEKIKEEQKQHPETHLSELGKELLDFYVFPPDHVLDSIQFIPQDQGYIFTTVLTSKGSEAWIFAADNLKQGAIAKLSLPEDINFGFTLHSEYFDNIAPRKSTYNVNRLASAVRSLTKVPGEYIFKRPNDVLNRKVS
jgi:carotenoid cleavage dioxygenase-like enzyme